MAEAWKKAKEFIDGLRDYPDFVMNTELKKSFNFKQGQFTINQYLKSQGKESPEKLGMGLKKAYTVDKAMYDKILSFTKERNLTVKPKIGLIYLVDSNNIEVALITGVDFYASTPELFEAIGKEIYGLKI